MNHVNNVENLIKEFNNNLPSVINKRFTLEQVFGNNENVWIIFRAPARGTVVEDEEAIQFLIDTMKYTPFVESIQNNGTSVSIQIIAENQQNIATGSIGNKLDNFILDEAIKKTIEEAINELQF